MYLTGTVTFLFTDIQGSTRLWQSFPGAMPAALARHHEILNHAVAAHRGYVFQIIGDAFCAAFSTVSDGLNAALAAQRALRDEPWGETGPILVRMSLHTGAAELRAGDFTSGEYVSGITLSRAARLLSAGHGGQILLSASAAELLREQLPPEVTLRDLGAHRLKDLARPLQIFQVLASDLPADFPPLKTLDLLPNNLPVQLTSFVGREAELGELAQLLRREGRTARLVTLTGVGGTGKTRLALEVAARVLEDFRDGVWLVELASLTDPALVPQAVASALGLREQPGRPPLDVLEDFLARKDLLLILDNCEHLIEACAESANALLRAAPQLRILATSREALGVAGESTYPVRSLSFPDPGHLQLETLPAHDAVRLFLERAVSVQPAFQLTSGNAPAIAQVCARLDGIPLAVELAAARVRGLSVEQIALRLDDRFRLLTGGSRTALPRQRTLQAAIDWSFKLLAPEERLLFQRLAVFAGGWTLEAAEQVCAGEQVQSADVLDLLLRLVDKSLVVADTEAAEPRYHMLETIRQYAQEKLDESGDVPALRDRHLAFFTALGLRAEPAFDGPDQLVWQERIERDQENVRAALTWAEGGGSVSSGLKLAAALRRFWLHRHHLREGCDFLERLLARPEASEDISAMAVGLLGAGALGALIGDRATAARHLDQSKALWRQLGPSGKRGIAIATSFEIALDLIFGNNPERARRQYEENLVAFQEIGDEWWIAADRFGIGRAALRQGDFTQARASYESSRAGFRALGDHIRATSMGLHLGIVAFYEGRYAEARAQIEEALRVYRLARFDFDIDTALWLLGAIAVREGKYAEARAWYTECLKVDQWLGALNQLPECMIGFAGIAAAESRFLTVARLLAAAEVQAEARGALDDLDRAELERLAAVLRVELDAASLSRAWAEGRALTVDQAIELALRE